MKNYPTRFTNAVTKLYNAFHNGELDAARCDACAVGNLCNNDSRWRYIRQEQGDFLSGYLYDSNIRAVSLEVISKTGYSAKELVEVENRFLKAMGYHSFYQLPIKEKDAEKQFKGLCAVVEYLCELDNIPNVVDIQSLFNTENDAPVKQLSEVL